MGAAATLPTHAELLQAGEARLRAAGIATARLDAEVLLAHVMAADRSALYAHLLRAASTGVERSFAALTARRARREPLAYIIGEQEFWSLPFAVTPAVLIPRPETELLVEIACRVVREGDRALRQAQDAALRQAQDAALRQAQDAALRQAQGERAADLSICDVGTGSGCIAIALARELTGARVVATDVSADALAVAARNAETHGVAERITFAPGDLFAAVDPRHRFDVIVSNPPYLAPGDAVSPEIACEPSAAFTAGADGLGVIRRLIDTAAAHLRDDGHLIIELGRGQDAAARALAATAGWTDIAVEPDLAGIPRALVARRPRAGGGE